MRGWDTAENITPTGSDAIALNSKSKEEDGYWCFSNFHGAMGVPCAEMEYQASKWERGLMRRPFRIMWERCSERDAAGEYSEFQRCLAGLQPSKKWTPAKKRFWFREGRPILGILFKLAQGAVKDGREGNRRLEFLLQQDPATCESLGVAAVGRIPTHRLEAVRKEYLRGQMEEDEKLQVMVECMWARFTRDAPARELLLSTGSRFIYERPLRGEAGLWTLRLEPRQGKNLFGRALMCVRDMLVNIPRPMRALLPTARV